MNSKFLRKLLNQLPRKMRHEFFRDSLSLPWDLEDGGVQFKFVTEISEFMDALKIIHDSYVGVAFMEPDPLGIRLTPYQLMPSTIMAVAKVNGKVAATMSLIRDNQIGLPMEKIFDLSHLRVNGDVLCEFSSLAIAPDYRGQGGQILHSFFRFFFRYTQKWYGVDHFVIAVNPSMAELYEALYLFQPLNLAHKVDAYDFVKGAPAVALFLPLREFDKNLKDVYFKKKIKKNLYHFLQVSNAKTDLFPYHQYYNVISSIITPAFIEQLRNYVVDLDGRFSDIVKTRIARSMGYNYFEEIGREQPRHQRFPMNTSTLISLEIDTTPIPVKVCDVSQGGIRLFIGQNQKMSMVPQTLEIQIGPEVKSKILVEPMWFNSLGYVGFNLKSCDYEWARLIRKLEHPINLPQAA